MPTGSRVSSRLFIQVSRQRLYFIILILLSSFLSLFKASLEFLIDLQNFVSFFFLSIFAGISEQRNQQMGPSRKPKSVNTRFTNEASPELDVENLSKSKQRKKKLIDKLGHQWTSEELERFYDAYRKHGRDWNKVAAAVQNNRSFDMVEALFHMNRAYLSLPEGIASVAGLIAMMTDHYNIIEASGSEGEGHDSSGVPRKYQKRKRAKVLPYDLQAEVVPQHSIASAEGCLAFLKQTQVYEKERLASGKRTPRFLVYEKDDRECSTPPNKRTKKQLHANDDDIVIPIRTLNLVSKRGGESPYRRTDPNNSTRITLGKMLQAKDAQLKHHDSSMFENGVRISQDRRHKKGTPERDGPLLMDMEGVGTMEVPQKGKYVRVGEAEGIDSDVYGDACNANEGLNTKPQKGMLNVKALRGKYSLRCPKKRNKKLLYGDNLEALQALSDLCASLPLDGLMESESSAQLEKERIAKNEGEKFNTPETLFTSHDSEKAIQARPEDSLLRTVSAAGNRTPKFSQESVDGNAISLGELGSRKRRRNLKVLGVEASKDSLQSKSLHNKESTEYDNLKTLVKTRRADQGLEKQLKTAKTLEESFSATNKKTAELDAVVSASQVSGSGAVSFPLKPPNRRKMSLKKSLQEKAKSSETTRDKPHSYETFSAHEILKEKVSTCLSCPLVRRRCIFEWFYSAIDQPWFAKMEFTDYLNHVGLGHVPRLTRLEWSVIKSSLGRPRRFSERFIQEERDKLKQYRDTVRKHYSKLRAGATEGLPTDVARPLSVGNRVIAIHPKTREIRDGKILTVDHNKCNVLFDELGVDLVMDIDCMPLNPLEYMPEGLRRQVDKCLSVRKEAELNRHLNSDVSVLFSPSVFENVKFSMNPSVKQDDISGPILLGKVLATNTDQSTATNSKARETESQRAPTLQLTSDAQDMEPEMIEILSGSKSIAQVMVDAAVKAASAVENVKEARNMAQQVLSSIGEHRALSNSIVKHQKLTNGSLDHHPSNTAELMTKGVSSLDGSRNNETQMPTELITSCVATWLMIQMCTEKQYPPADVAQLIEKAVSSLQPRCPQNMPIYREIQTCMGLIKTQIMALVRT